MNAVLTDLRGFFIVLSADFPIDPRLPASYFPMLFSILTFQTDSTKLFSALGFEQVLAF